jgi:4-hydroxybenzoate polyprenyltransferase
MSSAEVVRPSAAGAWLQLARVSNTPTVVSNAVAGAVLASTAAEAGTVAVVAAAMALFYTAGMILNDLLDFEVDRRERPERPLPSGQVSRGAALAVVVALFVAGETLLVIEGWQPALAGLGLIGLIVLYDTWHKGNVFSPVLMGGCRFLVYVVAALAVAGEVAIEVWTAAAVLLLYIVGLTQVAKAEGSTLLSAWPLAAVLAAIGYWVGWVDSVWMVVLLVVFAAWVWRALWLVRGPRRIGEGVVSLIAGVSLFDALAVASAGGGIAPVAVCLAAFVLTIALQTRIAGT